MSNARGDGDAHNESEVEDLLTTIQRWGAIIWRRIRNMLSFNRGVVRRRWGIRIIDTIRRHPSELLCANVDYVREPRASTSANTAERASTVQNSSNSATAGSAAAEPYNIQYLHPGPSNLRHGVEMMDDDDNDSDEYVRSSSDTEDDDDDLTGEDSSESESEQEPGPSGLHQDMELRGHVPCYSRVERALAINRRIRAQRRDRTVRRRFARSRLASPLECIVTPQVVASCSTAQHVGPTEDQPAAVSPGIEDNAGNVSNDAPAPKIEDPDEAEGGTAQLDQTKSGRSLQVESTENQPAAESPNIEDNAPVPQIEEPNQAEGGSVQSDQNE